MDTKDTLIARKNVRVQAIVLGVGLLLMLAKFGAWHITRSNAVLSDALESIINISAGTFALFSLRFAARPRDQSHPYGHGKVEYLAAGFEGALILISALAIIVKATYNFWHPPVLSKLSTGMLVTAIAGIINFGLGKWLIGRGRQSHSLIMVADGQHLQSDGWTSLGLIIGLVLVQMTGKIWIDGIAAIVFAAIIMVTGYRLVRRSIGGIMDESDHQLIDQVVGILAINRRPNWIDLHNLRVIKYGAILHLDAHMTIPWYLNAREAHDEMDAVEKLVHQEMGNQVEVFIHQDPCKPYSCGICRKMDCPVREHPFEREVRWSLVNLMRDEAHHAQMEQIQDSSSSSAKS